MQISVSLATWLSVSSSLMGMSAMLLATRASLFFSTKRVQPQQIRQRRRRGGDAYNARRAVDCFSESEHTHTPVDERDADLALFNKCMSWGCFCKKKSACLRRRLTVVLALKICRLRPCLVKKSKIKKKFRHLHGDLNLDEIKNALRLLSVNGETNLMNLIRL